MIVINGFPKSGNHALKKALELLGQPAQINHIPFAEGLPEGATKHIFIKRDPRNVIISALRWTKRPVTPGMFLTQFRSFELGGPGSLIEQMATYEAWLSDPQTLVIRFEYLIASDSVMRDIAAFLGVPYIDGAFEELPGWTLTWNDTPSNYLEVWTPEVQEAWAAEGGDDLLARWGY